MTSKNLQIEPPKAKIEQKVTSIHGLNLVDNYSWLRDKTNPDVIEFLTAENNYTKSIMKHTKPFQESLYKEMLSRIKETDDSVPVRIDNYFYYHRTEKGKQYRIYCRKNGSLEAEEEIILDINELAKGYEYFDLGSYEISPNHELLAYSSDTTGYENYIIYVKNLKTGELLSEKLSNAYYLMEWANDNKTLFYNTLEEKTKRPHQIYRHVLGTDQSEDVMIYEEEDQKFYLILYRTKDRKYIMFLSKSKTTSEIRYIDSDNPEKSDILIFQRQQDIEYIISHHNSFFYILTNENAHNFKLLKTPVDSLDKNNWIELISHDENIKLDSIETFENHLVIYKRKSGLKAITVLNLKEDFSHDISFPEPVYTINNLKGDYNPEFKTSTLRFQYTSLVTPVSIYDYHMDKKNRELMKQIEVLGGYNPALYESERVYATASDGTKIYMSIVYKKGMTKNNNNSLILYGYGSYGASTDPAFSSLRLSLLDRGFIFALAHIRGGGEMGRLWYENGKLLRKKNTFTDFITCAEYLINSKYTSKDKLTIVGGSAGGLLVGAVVNMRPDLVKLAVARVPFVDVINSMLDESIPLTVFEFEEWGNPKDKEFFDYMLSYSPYDNVEAKDYPEILITAGLNDPRVHFWEPAKWCAKLRAIKTDNNLLLLKTNMGTGHGGASGRYDYLKEEAFVYAFILDRYGINN
jgi:oligopeptidase B